MLTEKMPENVFPYICDGCQWTKYEFPAVILFILHIVQPLRILFAATGSQIERQNYKSPV